MYAKIQQTDADTQKYILAVKGYYDTYLCFIEGKSWRNALIRLMEYAHSGYDVEKRAIFRAKDIEEAIYLYVKFTGEDIIYFGEVDGWLINKLDEIKGEEK